MLAAIEAFFMPRRISLPDFTDVVVINAVYGITPGGWRSNYPWVFIVDYRVLFVEEFIHL